MEKTLGNFNTGLLRKVLSLPTASGYETKVQQFIIDYANEVDQAGEINIEQDEKGNIYITKGVPDKGGYYPCMVAHMDGARSYLAKKVVVTVPNKKRLVGYDMHSGRQEYLAADDLVGVFIALSALRELPAYKCAFFVEEEVGCIGSRSADMEFFNSCGYVLQSDRTGNNDVIYNAGGTVMASKSFKQLIKPVMKEYKMAFANGSMTDVMQLKENGMDVCALNISSAYFDAHMATEYVDLVGLEKIYNFIGSMIRLLGNKRYQHQYDPTVYSYGEDWYGTGRTQSKYDGYDSWDYDRYQNRTYNRDTNSWETKKKEIPQSLGRGLTTEALARELDNKKLESSDWGECVECDSPLMAYNNWLCGKCSDEYQKAGIQEPDLYPSVF